MKTHDGYQQCDNAQLAVASDWQLIVETMVGNNASDNGALEPLLDEIEHNQCQGPEVLVADAGYRDESCFEALEVRNIDAYISVGSESKTDKSTDGDKYPVVTQRMSDKLARPESKDCYAQRKAIVEPVTGWVKHVLGFRQFSVRGHQAVRGEWALVCLALNLRRMQPLLGLE